MDMKKGDIWVIDAGNFDGHEQSGIRPAVIVTNVTGPTVVVIPCTTNVKALKFQHTIELFPTKENNLTVNSIAMVFQIRAIDIKRLKNKVGKLSTNELKLINKVIKKMFEI